MAKKKKKQLTAETQPSSAATDDITPQDLHDLNFKAVSDFWLMLRDKGSAIYNALPADQRPMFQAVRDGARDAFFKAVNAKLSDNNALIADMRKSLTEMTASLKEELADLKKVEAVLKKLTEAVKFASSIVTLAAA